MKNLEEIRSQEAYRWSAEDMLQSWSEYYKKADEEHKHQICKDMIRIVLGTLKSDKRFQEEAVNAIIKNLL